MIEPKWTNGRLPVLSVRPAAPGPSRAERQCEHDKQLYKQQTHFRCLTGEHSSRNLTRQVFCMGKPAQPGHRSCQQSNTKEQPPDKQIKHENRQI